MIKLRQIILEQSTNPKALILAGSPGAGKSSFIEGVKDLIKEDVKVNGEYYVGTSINYLINKGLRVKIFEVDNWISFGDPTELNLYYFWQDYMRDIN